MRASPVRDHSLRQNRAGDRVNVGEIGSDIAARALELSTRLVLFLIMVAIVIALGRLARPLVRARLARRNRPSFTRVFTALYGTVVAMGSVLLGATLAFPSVQMVDVLASLGIVSVAVGFAFKDVLENLLAGVLLLLRDPFKSGDQIRVGAFEGTVEGITVRETLLRTHDGQRVLLPNAHVYISPLEVLTHNAHTRISFPVRLDASADLATARAVIVAALRDLPDVASQPAPDVVVTDVAVGEITVECRLWTAAPRAALTAARDSAIPAALAAVRAAAVPLANGELLIRHGDDHGSCHGHQHAGNRSDEHPHEPQGPRT